MCVTRSIVHGSLSATTCLAGNGDRAEFGGRFYTDKAPGVSFLAIPAAQAVRLGPAARGTTRATCGSGRCGWRPGGIALLVCALLLGRVAEGIAPGWGGATLVTFSVGNARRLTRRRQLRRGAGSGARLRRLRARVAAPARLGRDRRRSRARRRVPGGAGRGCSSALYVALAGGQRARPLRRRRWFPVSRCSGSTTGSRSALRFHLSYRYVSKQFAVQQAGGFFGIHAPSLARGRGSSSSATAASSSSRPCSSSPQSGSCLLWRRGARAESLLCGAVSVAFLVLELGYYDPYGGDSPGPRFFIPALPFLAVGLAPAFARWRGRDRLLRGGVGRSLRPRCSSPGPHAVNAAPRSTAGASGASSALFVRHGSSSELAHLGPEDRLRAGSAPGGSAALRSSSRPRSARFSSR